MIKVEQTKPYNILQGKNNVKGVLDRLVTDAKLVLVEKEFGNLEEGYIKVGKYEPKWVKPILISETEKIEDGDLKYCPLDDVMRIHKQSGQYYDTNEFKIIALPEHFSPQQLQMIVGSKLKDGDKVLVECEQIDVDEAYSIVSANRDYNKHHFHYYDSGMKTYKKKFENLYRKIKLNPHITIYPVEEKMYTEEEMYKKTYEAMVHGFNQTEIEDGLSYTHRIWFEQNVK